MAKPQKFFSPMFNALIHYVQSVWISRAWNEDKGNVGGKIAKVARRLWLRWSSISAQSPSHLFCGRCNGRDVMLEGRKFWQNCHKTSQNISNFFRKMALIWCETFELELFFSSTKQCHPDEKLMRLHVQCTSCITKTMSALCIWLKLFNWSKWNTATWCKTSSPL